MGKCIIKYKGKKYSEEQFKEYFINNKQEFATSIAKNKDVIDSFKRKMEGIDFVFSQSSELASIGSKAQYLQYLSTIFKTSKVKDIVYRGKTENQTNKKSKELGIFFTDDKNAANIYAIKYKGDEFDDSIIQGVVNKFGLNPTIEQIKSEIAFFEKMGATKEQIEKDAKEFQKYILNNKGIAEQAIINIKNPKNLTVKDWFDNYDNSSSLKENSDGLLLKGGKQSDNRIYDAGENQIVVFEPEQIHILGSKADIQGFKEFAQGKQFQKLTQEEKAKTIEQVTKEHRSIAALKDLSAKFAHRIGGTVKFENNPNADWKGYNQGMKSVLNEAYMTPDTPFHEILAHPIIRAIKKSNPELYQSLLKELETGRGKEVFEQVKRDYNRKKPLREKPNPNDSDYLPEENQYEPRYYSEQEYLDDLELWKQERDDINNKYTLEEQQEEAIVTLLGLMAADKLDAKKDKNLISLLKELLLQMSEYIKSLFTAKEIRISELNVSNLEFLTNRKIEDFIKSGKIRKEC